MQRRDLFKSSFFLLSAFATRSVASALHAGVHAHPAGIPSATDFFSAPQRLAVTRLCDMIIPPTDTPGAAEAGVPAFIESIVADWYRPAERDIFMGGLTQLDAFCQRQEEQPFFAASEDTRTAALRHAEEQAAAYTPSTASDTLTSMGQQSDENAPFFTKLRELVLLGYYTSEMGATQELAYNPVPGYYDGDYPIDQADRHWVY